MPSERGAATLKAAAQGIHHLFLSSLASKVLTFAANVAVVRYTSPEQQGFKLQLELIAMSVLFFGREAFRVAALRMDMSEAVPVEEIGSALRHTMNVGALSALFTAALLAGVWFVGLPMLMQRSQEWQHAAAELQLPGAFCLFLVGAFLETLCEPLYMTMQGMALNKLRSYSEAAALFVRSLAPIVLIQLGFPPLLAFGWSWVLYGTVMTGTLYFYFSVQGCRVGVIPATSALAVRRDDGVLMPAKVSSCLLQLQLESSMRLVLQEAEKVVLSSVAPLAEQGVFQVVSHLGGMLCRLLFRFIEESSLAIWSKLVSIGALEESQRVLVVLLRFLCLLGFIFCAFGPAYSHSLLFILYGTKWTATDGPEVLAAYCLYLSLMGINGSSEAFNRAAATDAHLQRLWKVQCVFSCVSVALSVLSTTQLGLGLVGLVWSSSVVMCLRTAFCLHYARSFLPSFRVRDCIPAPSVVAATAGAFVATKASQRQFFPRESNDVKAMAMHIAVGAVIFLAYLGVVYKAERRLFGEMRSVLRGEAAAKPKNA
eukprot:TRINITY_DN30557_c0_g1_i1.p1 TRINITY_DN30557_c0_g1~~TRINITY_DN30557_c0_g1_i1.p1  ORF type:complete len:540 (+),score=193.53 TRINITY_DN30557_c0_g1_i1:54-1673(+)